MLVINKRAVREAAYEICETRYPKGSPYKPTQISKRFFEAVNQATIAYIRLYVSTRPSKGVTL